MMHFLVFAYMAPAYLFSSGSASMETQDALLVDIWKGRSSLSGVTIVGPYIRVEGKYQPDLIRTEGLLETLYKFLLSDNRELTAYVTIELGHRGLSRLDLDLFLTAIRSGEGREAWVNHKLADAGPGLYERTDWLAIVQHIDRAWLDHVFSELSNAGKRIITSYVKEMYRESSIQWHLVDTTINGGRIPRLPDFVQTFSYVEFDGGNRYSLHNQLIHHYYDYPGSNPNRERGLAELLAARTIFSAVPAVEKELSVPNRRVPRGWYWASSQFGPKLNYGNK